MNDFLNLKFIYRTYYTENFSKSAIFFNTIDGISKQLFRKCQILWIYAEIRTIRFFQDKGKFGEDNVTGLQNISRNIFRKF